MTKLKPIGAPRKSVLALARRPDQCSAPVAGRGVTLRCCGGSAFDKENPYCADHKRRRPVRAPLLAVVGGR